MTRRRWSNHDKNFGPFTYARCEKHYSPLAIVLRSGDLDEYPGCSLRVSGLGHTFIVALPAIIKPWKEKVEAHWDDATVARLGRDWYWNADEREYGLSCDEGFLQVFLGRQSHDSSTEQRWSSFLPWTQWRFVRHSMYDLQGNHFWTEPPRQKGNRANMDSWYEAKESCPSITFAFADFDGEMLSAKTRIEERQWEFGQGWFGWLSVFRKPKIHRSLDIEFSGETGKKKGSWKGGTVGHSIEMLPEELHMSAFQRYCAEHNMTYKGVGLWLPKGEVVYDGLSKDEGRNDASL